jgi:hypothetical protein
MLWLKEAGCTVIALRDVARFTAGRPVPADPMSAIDRRLQAAAAGAVQREAPASAPKASSKAGASASK